MNSKYQSRNGNRYRKRPVHHPYHSQDYHQQEQQQQDSGRFRGSNEMDCAILISNLMRNVSKSDFQDLFYNVGHIVHADVHTDESKRMVGTAVVVFESRSAAVQASKEFDGYKLGEHPMKIKLMNSRSPKDMTRRAPRPQHQHASYNRKPRNNKHEKQSTKTAEELDAELDEYNKKRDESK
ncbi:PREDICTED: aly/REF export factor 2-like [Nicrophorus vespilloides]|uniref:Aly/REF export factor 2-like n=1 Tax=Nicrophorus vespilloides TaxID=110193 RepID=A0ABM1MD42_NICVS|nr:PREDICTED: aly/REF export factor 2-like [Nicrophorus vespilloides]